MFFFFDLPRLVQAVIKKLVRLIGNERMAMVMDWVHEYTRDEIDDDHEWCWAMRVRVEVRPLRMSGVQRGPSYIRTGP